MEHGASPALSGLAPRRDGGLTWLRFGRAKPGGDEVLAREADNSDGGRAKVSKSSLTAAVLLAAGREVWPVTNPAVEPVGPRVTTGIED